MLPRLALACIGLLMSLAAWPQEQRLALVIGNAAYRSAALKNPVNDSRAVAEALRELGFTVIERENTTLRSLISALQDFSVRARSSQVRVVFYAGHGVQVRGRNYLIPVDADIADEDEVPRKSADVNDLLERLGELRGGTNIVMLDACRNNPFLATPVLDADARRSRTRSAIGVAGLARVDAPNGTLIAYSTAPGTVAIDGAGQGNSVYTRHLLANLRVPGQTVEVLFKRVRTGVASETQFLQVPWEASSLMGEFCFREGPGGRCGG